MYFQILSPETPQEVADALLEHGAVMAEVLDTVFAGQKQYAHIHIMVENDFDLRRLVALLNRDLDPREKDPAIIGAAVARAGEFIVHEER
ncbi:MAG: hypothetical protein M1546_10575 [Chloroflexi bacterium]|nr:hypothetical protein [Chloroflexota bacterium]